MSVCIADESVLLECCVIRTVEVVCSSNLAGVVDSVRIGVRRAGNRELLDNTAFRDQSNLSLGRTVVYARDERVRVVEIDPVHAIVSGERQVCDPPPPIEQELVDVEVGVEPVPEDCTDLIAS